MNKSNKKMKLIDTPVYNYWEALYQSFYSRRLYVDVGKRWRGVGLMYFLLVIAIFSLPFVVRVGLNLNQTFNEQIIEPLEQLPNIYVQNGEVLFDKPMPYLIRNKKDKVVLIIDTTGTVEQFNEQYPELSILINKHTFYFKVPTPQLFAAALQEPNASVPLAQTFEKTSNFVFNGKKLINENNMVHLKYLSQALIYPAVVAILFFMFVVLMLALSFLGQIFSSIFFSFKISFKQSARLFFVATTPMLFILMTLLTLDAMFSGAGFILLTLVVIYFSLAVFSLKAESKQITLK